MSNVSKEKLKRARTEKIDAEKARRPGGGGKACKTPNQSLVGLPLRVDSSEYAS